MPPRVHVVGTGGTIASVDVNGGAKPRLGGDDLVEAVPAIREHAALTVTEVDRRPSFDMDGQTVAAVAHAARDAAADGVDGIVVTHGTSTMEESAFYLDATLDLDVPVVLTGAMRRPDEVSPDGPMNLLTAVRVAADDRFDGGAFVAIDETVHAARDATKVDAHRLDAFDSPNAGPVASVTRDRIRLRRPPRGIPVTLPIDEIEAAVDVVPSGLGIDGRAIRRAVADGVDGLVVVGTGLGNTTAAIGDAVADAIAAGVPVVVTTRCLVGAVASVYGTPGGGRTLRDHGAIPGGDLTPGKARILLALALARGDDAEDLRELFDAVAPAG